MNYFKKFHFSVTCSTDDEAVVHCLRALCQWAEETPHPHKAIGWGHTKISDWQRKQNQITLRFTADACRVKFINEAGKLLEGRWKKEGQSDDDPATPTRKRKPGLSKA